MRRLVFTVGQQFGQLTITSAERVVLNGETYVRCRCECGRKRDTKLRDLRSGHTKSCGCFGRSRGSIHSLRHGHNRRGATSKTYNSWSAMLQRCNNPKANSYERYGAAGVSVCTRWLSFANFLTDMGERPVGMTLDRKDNDKGYYKDNCRWTTLLEQGRNRRNTKYYGQKQAA